MEEAIFINDSEIMRVLVKAGANVNWANGRNGRTLLKRAAMRGRDEEVRVLVEAGANINLADKDEYTPL
jgi:hypothetical protein